MRVLLAGLVFAVAVRAAADEPRPTELRIRGKAGQLQAFLWRPAGPGPFPALVYNHGSEKEPIAGTASEVGPFFTRAGFAVLFPYRRGAGKSEGRHWRDGLDALSDDARQTAAIERLVAENDDVVAAIDWLRAQPWVESAAISVAGCSFGGIQTLLTAERGAGIHAAIDFAGGAMSWQGSPPLRERLLVAAERARVPVFFVQAENDFDTTPSRVLSEAMRQKKLPQRMRIYPPFGSGPRDGHGGFCMRGTSVWGADVIQFLRGK